MAEKTANLAAIAYGACPIKHAPAAGCATCDNIEEELRAAVAAQKEKLEATDFWSVACPDCCARSGFPCKFKSTRNAIHTERAIAAIRQSE